MNIIISNQSDLPIYEQIAESFKLLKEEVLRKIEEHLVNAVHMAVSYGIEQEELEDILSCLYEEGIDHGK